MGKKPNRVLNRLIAGDKLDRDYFCRFQFGTPVFSEREFERRYRMTRVTFETIRKGILEVDEYFSQKMDATGLTGATADQKLTSA